jgi:clan AA aspartic protease (TIGR02281 family)
MHAIMTRRVMLPATATFWLLLASLAAQGSGNDLDALYRAGRWFELRAMATERAPALIRGAVASAFNDLTRAERLLRGIIDSQPHSDAADDAYGVLCRAYISSGQYRRFVTTYRQWAAAFPSSQQLRAQEASLERFAGRPDQVDGPRHIATVRHDDDSFTVPVSMNGKTDDFLIDTGALHSVLTAREAKKFGLTLSYEIRSMTGASGDTVPFRTAVAKVVTIGATSFRDVSFAVIEPTGPFQDAEVGVVGMPLLRGLGSIRWSKDGTVQLGRSVPHARQDQPNLVFDRGRLLLKGEVLGKTVLMSLDTGASTSDLNANFVNEFPSLVDGGRKTRHDITGAGGTRTFDAVELPEVAFTIGPARVLLQPAHVTLQRVAAIGGECCIGNAGRDLLTQRQAVSIDFSTMTLRLQ